MTTWKSIPGFPDYFAGDDGRIKSERAWSRGVRPSRILTPSTGDKGYQFVSLRDEQGRPRTFKVHVLVMLAFAGPRPDGQQVRHLDSNPANNHRANLAYGTQLENMADRVELKTHCKNGHSFDEYGYRRPKSGRACRACLRIADEKRRTRTAAA